MGHLHIVHLMPRVGAKALVSPHLATDGEARIALRVYLGAAPWAGVVRIAAEPDGPCWNDGYEWRTYAMAEEIVGLPGPGGANDFEKGPFPD